MRIERSITHVRLSVLGIVESQTVDITFLRPNSGAFTLDQSVHFFAYTNQVFAFCVSEQLEQLGNRNGYAIVTRTSVRVFRLVLAVLGCTEFVLVRLFFLAFDSILLVDRSEE